MATDDWNEPLSRSRIAQLIIEHARDYAFMTLDLQGRITSWSYGAERILGYTAEEAVGMDFTALFTPSDRSAKQDQLELEAAWRDGRFEDSRWHLRRSGERFWANGMTIAFRDADAKGLIKIFRDETVIKLAEEQRILLLNELNHRINNTLATVQSLVDQTLRAAEVDRAVRENITARLMALSEAHNALVEQNWAGADLHAIVDRAIAPYQPDSEQRIAADGPVVRLSPQQAVSMSLVLHELVTNAVKYGSLSTPEGKVEVSWNLHLDSAGARHMTFLWGECGGPSVTPPTRRGFGSRLIAKSFGETAGDVRTEFAPEGVRCTINLRLSSLAEAPMLDVRAALVAAS